MRIKFLLLAVIAASALTNIACAEDAPPAAPAAFIKLLKERPAGAKVLLPDGFDLSKPGAAWLDKGAQLDFEQTYRGYGSYVLRDKNQPDPKEPDTITIHRSFLSAKGITVKANRSYAGSVLIKTNFERKTGEVNFYLRLFNAQGMPLAPRHIIGAPAATQGPAGWQRLNWTVNIPDDPAIALGRFVMDVLVTRASKPAQVQIADFSFTELPAAPLKPLPRGVGVTFPGGPGKLPMHIVSATTSRDHLVVETTGAKFDFDTKDSTILASQRNAFPRDLVKWQSSLSLAGLRVDKKTPDVVVLSNNNLTIGIQGDSMMAISPQKNLTMTLTNLLGGDFNRYARGHLFSTDDFGGFTVNPYIPLGTGLRAQSKLLTPNLSFAHFAERDYDAIGQASPNWRAQWTTRPGELLCTSVFPPRPYPWEESFHFGWKLVHRSAKLADYNQKIPFVSVRIMWDFIPKTWGHSYSDYYAPYDDAEMRQNIKAIHDAGQKAIPYASGYWTPTRHANIYIDGIRKMKNEYGIDGVYSDGLPSANWLLAYKEMRMLRQLFPDGPVIVHDSFRQSGKPISEFMPFLYSYATAMYMAEGVETKEGENWQYTRYVTSMFRKTNTIGVTKGDKWMDAAGEKMNERRALVDDVYNGRDNIGFAYSKHYGVLEQLHALWKEKGSDPFFYDRYYLPKAQELTGYRIGRTAMPIVERAAHGNSVTVTIQTLTPDAKIYYTTDGSTPTVKSLLYEKPLSLSKQKATVLKARALADGLDPSAVVSDK